MISLTSPVETRAHGWPAGLKLGLLSIATLILFATQDILWHLSFMAVAAVLYALPGWRFFRVGAGRLWLLWPFVLGILLWHLLTADLLAGCVIVVRMVTAVALANLVTMTTRLTDMIDLVQWLLTPLRRIGVPTRGIELAMALVIRFTPVLADKARQLMLSWRARSARRLGWPIVVPLAVIAIDDAERVAEALRARGGL